MAKYILKNTTNAVKSLYKTWLHNPKINSNELFISKAIAHANFVDQELKLSMFIPCDKHDVPLPFTIGNNGTKIYTIGSKHIIEAKNNILFNGWYCYDKNNITNGRYIIDFLKWKIYESDSVFSSKINRIEDLYPFNVELSQRSVEILKLHKNS